MGKQRRQRQKLHIPPKNELQQPKNDQFDSSVNTSQPILMQPCENLFAGIDINLGTLKKPTPDDVQSIKSLKSLKSEKGANKQLSKKDKHKLRHDLLLKKIDAVNQMKLEMKRRKKRKNVSIIGDTNPLHDALPSLQSLLDSRPKSSCKKVEEHTKRKGVEKTSKRKKQLVQGVQMFKQVLANKAFQKDPLRMVAEQVKVMVEHGKMKDK